MDRYIEYMVRCKSCGFCIAGISDDYEDLVLNQGMSRVEAFQALDITEDRTCCMDELMNPVTVFFDMTNRNVIEGLVPVENADKYKGMNPDDFLSQFGTCLEYADLSGVPRKKSKTKEKKTTDNWFDDEEDEIVEVGESGNNTLPQVPGMPTINPSTHPHKRIDVGSGKTTVKLSGRTFMAV
jgi:DNA-directed RNA polymerase subunit N (RpoN/RPB10)